MNGPRVFAGRPLPRQGLGERSRVVHSLLPLDDAETRFVSACGKTFRRDELEFFEHPTGMLCELCLVRQSHAPDPNRFPTVPVESVFGPEPARLSRVQVPHPWLVCGPSEEPRKDTGMGGNKHDGEDDSQTDHLGKGSDGHTVESGDDK